MSTRHFFRKVFGTLVPTTEAGREWLDSLPNGEIVAGEFKRPRNPPHSAKFHAMLDLVYKNQSIYKTRDDLLLAFKHAVGHGHWIRIKTVKPDVEGYETHIFQPHSISFAKMNQDEFNTFYNRAMDFVCEHVIPGMDNAELEKELRGFME